MQIIPGVYSIPSGMVNCYLIVDADGLTLVDTGMPRNDGHVLKTIAKLGHAPKDLKRIVITHADVDHYGSLAALKEATGARAYASHIEAEAIATGRASREIKRSGLQGLLFGLIGGLFKAQPATVDEILVGGSELSVLGRLRVVETPGHTPGHISLFAPSVKILFGGDSMVSENGRLRESRGFNTWDEAKARESVRMQAALGAEIVCVGHGPVVMQAGGKFPQV